MERSNTDGVWENASAYECSECGYLSYFQYRTCPRCKIAMVNPDLEYMDYIPIEE